MRSGSPLFVKIDATMMTRMPALEFDVEPTSDDSASPRTPEDEQSLQTATWPASGGENTILILVAPAAPARRTETAAPPPVAPLRRTETTPPPVPVAPLPAVARIKATTLVRSPPIVVPKPAHRRTPPGPSPLGRAKPLLAADLEAGARPARVLQLVCEEQHAEAVARLEKFVMCKSKAAPRADWRELKVALPGSTAVRVTARPRVMPTEAPLARRTAGAVAVDRRYQELLMMQLFF